MGLDLFPWERSASRGRGTFSAGPVRVSVNTTLNALLTTLILAIPLLSLMTRPAPAAPSGSGSPAFSWPCNGTVTAPFRLPSGPYGQGGHAGIDIAVPRGTPVKAAAAGTVTFSGNTPVGLCVSVSHAGGLKTTYVALAESGVRAGTRVDQGTRLGSSDGALDRSSSSPHLHFGASLNGVVVDPLLLLEGKLLDPSRDLYLGPWEDRRAIESLTRTIDSGGSITDAIEGVVSSLGRAAGGAAGAVWHGFVTAVHRVGDGCEAFYRACIEPWAGWFIDLVVSIVRVTVSNHYVQAFAAAALAIAVIALAVLAAGFTFGLSMTLVYAAIALASAACLGYAGYYASASGDAFSFTQCLTGCLMVGGTVALATITFGQSWSLLSAGFSKVGLLGFGKAFLVHGLADSLSYTVINGIAGRPFSLETFALTFVLGGLCGATGKLFVTGLSESMLQGMAAGSFAAGQAGSESFYLLKSSFTLLKEGGFQTLARAGAVQLGTALAEKLTYMTFCGCTAFLTDFAIHLATGKGFTFKEGLISFGAGFCVGGFSLAASTASSASVLSNAACVYRPMGTEFLRNYLKKSAAKGGKELIKQSLGSSEERGWEVLPSRE